MLLYYLFWMFMGFILYIIIIFGTNLLTGGPAHIAVFFAYFSISKKRNNKRSPNAMKPSGAWLLEWTWSRGLGVQVKRQSRKPREWRARPPYWARLPISWAPWASTDLILPPIYTHTPRKHPGAPRNPISTTATFCTCEILIRIQHIYNFLLFLAIILHVLDVYGLYFTHLYHFWD